MEGVPDDDGWIKVTKEGRHKAAPRKEVVMKQAELKEKKRRKEKVGRKGGISFPRFSLPIHIRRRPCKTLSESYDIFLVIEYILVKLSNI